MKLVRHNVLREILYGTHDEALYKLATNINIVKTLNISNEKIAHRPYSVVCEELGEI